MLQEYLNIGSGIAAVCAYYSFFGIGEAYKRGYQLNNTVNAIYSVAQPILWSLSLSWVIFTCHTGQAGMILLI